MNQIKNIIWALLLLFAASASVHAGLPFRVNEAHVNVADQSEATLQKALPQALSQVLIKMSGNSKVTSLPAVRTALPYAKRWLTNYTYINAQDATGQPQLILQATFNRNAMNSLLRDANQNAWSENRPVTLIWLHVEKGPLNYYLSGNDHGEISIDVKNSAYRRGIPFRVPMMDVPDQQLFMVNDPNPFTQDRLQTAVQRYNAQAILAGHIIYDNKAQIWSADWHLLQNNQLAEWNGNANNINDTISQAIDRVADTLAGNLNSPTAPVTAAGEANSTANPENNIAQTVRMAVLGINNLDDYAKLTQYLQSLPGVTAVTVNDMNNAMVIVNVNVDGGTSTLVNDLQNSALLKSSSPPADVADNTINAYYQWATAENNQQAPTANANSSATQSAENTVLAPTNTAETGSTAPELENTQ